MSYLFEALKETPCQPRALAALRNIVESYEERFLSRLGKDESEVETLLTSDNQINQWLQETAHLKEAVELQFRYLNLLVKAGHADQAISSLKIIEKWIDTISQNQGHS